MRLASGPVLGLAAVASSPALWGGLVTREIPVDVALTRYLVAVVVVWLALSAVAMLIGEPAGRAPDPAPTGGRDQGPPPGGTEPAAEQPAS